MPEQSYFASSPLITAAQHGDVEEMCRLVEQGADLSTVDPRSPEGRTGAHWLAVRQKGAQLLELAKAYPEVLGYVTSAGKTPVMELAMQFCGEDVFALAAHPDYGERVVTQVDNVGRTVSCYLVMRNDTLWVQTLMMLHEGIITAQSRIIRTAIEEHLYHLVKPLRKIGIALPDDFDQLRKKHGITRAQIGRVR